MGDRNFKDYLYTGSQFLLFVAFLINIHIYRIDFPYLLSIGGLYMAATGLVVLALALFQLRKSLSPFPRPLPTAQLITNGLYAHIRHPVYTGIILVVVGVSVDSSSIYRLILSLLLFILLI